MKDQTPHELVPKLFSTFRERYAMRPGGYTRVLRIEPLKPDMAPSAILELVDGPKDIRFAMTARTIAKEQAEGKEPTEFTAKNIQKVTRFRKGGQGALKRAVNYLRDLKVGERNNAASKEKRWGGTV